MQLYKLLQTWSETLQLKIASSVSSLSLRDIIRLTIFLGGYILLRPYLLQLVARSQRKELEKSDNAAATTSIGAIGEDAPLKERVQVPDDSSDDGEGGGASGGSTAPAAAADWGKAARRRQRIMLRNLLEIDEKRRLEEREDDKDIEEFLDP